MRTVPNFLITGTPGVGKTTLSEMIASAYELKHVPISRLVSDKHLWVERDEERDCTVYDDDLLEEAINQILEENPQGGVIFDFHCPDCVKIEDIDYVLVLRTNTDLLFSRLESRGYSQTKCTENVECEIFREILDEVLEDYEQLGEDNIIELVSDSTEDLDNAVERVGEIISKFNKE